MTYDYLQGREARDKYKAEQAELRRWEQRRARLRLAEACAEGELLRKLKACEAAGVSFDWSKATDVEREANERLRLRAEGWPI
jgi:hypothetical protein